ncbi:MAG: Hpt domain-containing protein [Nanoarchaeota archaeon]|nr:Hpt domain-containing protein [Nanoarchaeota archaeon]MBU1703880.1 Hpt domain-containing protein [Nanoarchaeota archaeon]
MQANIRLEKEYLEDTRSNLRKIRKALTALEKNTKDTAALDILMTRAHRVKGDSMLAKHFTMALLCHPMEMLTFRIKNDKKRLTKPILEFFEDIYINIMGCYKVIKKKEHFCLDPEFLQRLAGFDKAPGTKKLIKEYDDACQEVSR